MRALAYVLGVGCGVMVTGAYDDGRFGSTVVGIFLGLVSLALWVTTDKLEGADE